MRGCLSVLAVAALGLTLGVAPARSGSQAAAPARVASQSAPAPWSHVADCRVEAPGLVRLTLPGPFLNLARVDLGDVRVLDAQGRELPFLAEREAMGGPATLATRDFAAAVERNRTVLSARLQGEETLQGVALESPAEDFLKSVTVELSGDGRKWRTVARNRPIFRRSGGEGNLDVFFPPASAVYLRVTLDDARAPAIPVTALRARPAPRGAPEPARVTLKIHERSETREGSRLVLTLPGRHLSLAGLDIAAGDAMLMRRARAELLVLTDGEFRPLPLGDATVARAATRGKPGPLRLDFSDRGPLAASELALVVENGDSPPLDIRSVTALVLPVRLVFHAAAAGDYALALGNPEARAPSYDLAGLGDSLSRAPAVAAALGEVLSNPNHKAQETLPQLPELAGPFDARGWKAKAEVRAQDAPHGAPGGPLGPGVHWLELDPEALSRTARGRDLRLVKEGRQVPYVADRLGVQRTFMPQLVRVPEQESKRDDKSPRLDRWDIRLPFANLPITNLSFAVGGALFDRDVRLSELRRDERGADYRVELARTQWVRRPGQSPARQLVVLRDAPRTATLRLEIEMGDNAALPLTACEARYQAPRLLFKAAGPGLFLYYDHPGAEAPRYDIALAAEDLQAAEKSPAVLAARDGKVESAETGEAPLRTRAILWGAMGAVAVILLAVVTRLLPARKDGPEN